MGTTVGTIEYDVRLNLAQLKKDTAQAERMVNDSSKNMQKSQRQVQKSAEGSAGAIRATTAAIRGMQIATIALGAALVSNLGAGIRRLDTLNNFPRVMENFGLSAADGEVAIAALSQELIGLPTSLDAGARAVQRFTAVNNDVKASTALFLGFNNALIAGGATMDIQNTALEQLSQAYSKGRVNMIEWRSLLTAMPAQLNQVAEAMGISADELGEGLRDGSISVDEFLLTIAKLNKEGVGQFASFKEQAMNQVGGVQVTLTNLNTAIARSIEGMLSAIGTDDLRTIIGGIADLFTNFGRGVSGTVQLVKTIGPAGVAAGAGMAVLTAAMIATRNATTLAGRAALIYQGILTALSRHPIIFALTAIVGGLTAVGAAMGMFNSETEDSVDYAKDLENSLKNYEAPVRGATDAAGELGKKMEDIDKQIKKANTDYRYQLAQLVADKNKNIASLQATLGAEEKAYNNAYAERLSSFNKTQDEEEKSHEQKVRELQNQIDFLSQYNTQANNQQVSELQFALARENAEYQKSTQLRKAEFDAQTKSEFEEYEKRRKENQKKLNQELALLNKHKDAVRSVRNVMLRDEIQDLQHSRNEQLKSLRQRAQDARAQGDAAGSNFSSGFNSNINDMIKQMENRGKRAGGEFGQGFIDRVNRKLTSSSGFFKTLDDYFYELGTKVGSNTLPKVPRGLLGFGFSDGGYTGRGGVNEPAGIVHRGEYVVPKENVNQSTGMPEFGKMGNTTVYNTFNLSGIMASGKSDMRKIANQMGKLMNETAVSKTGKAAIKGI